jgi:hypothetical protein
MNDHGHNAIRIYGHERHRGLVAGDASFIGYEIEPDLGLGADSRGVFRGHACSWKLLAANYHVMVVVRSGLPTRYRRNLGVWIPEVSLHTFTRVKVRAERAARY